MINNTVTTHHPEELQYRHRLIVNELSCIHSKVSQERGIATMASLVSLPIPTESSYVLRLS